MVPKEMRYFAQCKGETIIQVHAAGPFNVNWVNPAEVIPPDCTIPFVAQQTSQLHGLFPLVIDFGGDGRSLSANRARGRSWW